MIVCPDGGVVGYVTYTTITITYIDSADDGISYTGYYGRWRWL